MKEKSSFASASEVWQWISDNSYRISRSSFFRHIQEGRLRPDKKGSFSRRRVKEYCEAHLVKRSDLEEADQLARRAAKAKAEILEARVRAEKRKEKREAENWISRDDYEMACAGRASVFKAGLQNLSFYRMSVYRDADSIEEAMRLFDEDVVEVLNNMVSQDEYRVVFHPDKVEVDPFDLPEHWDTSKAAVENDPWSVPFKRAEK
jgi:hypothetical protein